MKISVFHRGRRYFKDPMTLIAKHGNDSVIKLTSDRYRRQIVRNAMENQSKGVGKIAQAISQVMQLSKSSAHNI